MTLTVIKGRLTEKPSLSQTNSGKKVVSVNVAVDIGYGDSKKAEYYRVLAWEEKAEFFCRYFEKGQEVLIQGEMRSRKYRPTDYSKDITVWELVARSIEFCGSKQSNKQTMAEEAPAQEHQNFPVADGFQNIDINDGDLPF